MERRFAVLWDVVGPVASEAGVVVEKDDHVLVDVSSRYGIPRRQRGEFKVGAPDGSLVVYRPGDDGYFDHVLIALASTFAVGEQGTIQDSETTVPELYARKVTNALIAKRRSSYAPGHTTPFQHGIPAAPVTLGRSRQALFVA